MKQILSKDQVNANLKKMDAKNAICYSIVYNRYTDQPTFYIWQRGKGVVVVENKMVYWHSFIEPLTGDEAITKSFRGMVCREYITRSRWNNRQNKSDKETVEKILLCCGMKSEKKILAVTPEQRLKQLEYGNLVPIYKMIMEIELISADLEMKELEAHDYWGNVKSSKPYLALVVKHTRGSFSLPIENYEDEIQNIFFNALSLPVTSKLKTA